VLLFVGDDVPEGQYTPDIVKALAPAGMVAELVSAPYFVHPPDSLRTTVLHNIMAGGRYPGADSTRGRGRVRVRVRVGIGVRVRGRVKDRFRVGVRVRVRAQPPQS